MAPEQKLFYGNFLLHGSVERVLRTRGLISLKSSRPGLVYIVFCGSRAEVVLWQFLLPDSVERVLEPGS